MDSHFQKCGLLAEEGEHIVTSAFVTKARVLKTRGQLGYFYKSFLFGVKDADSRVSDRKS